jgi:hypothetical protein
MGSLSREFIVLNFKSQRCITCEIDKASLDYPWSLRNSEFMEIVFESVVIATKLFTYEPGFCYR